MRLPDFLIIGAMKSGTTTLFNDLRQHPRVFAPVDKEPHALCEDAVLTDAGKADYAAHFAKAGAGQVCGEASTGYTKLPVHEGVPGRAHALLGSDLKLIYLVRDPIARLISHHHHIHVEGKVGPDINEAVASCSDLTDFSRYAMQLGPWIDRFGRDRVLILRFEDMVAQRQATAERAWAFLGLEEMPGLSDPARVSNASANKPYHAGVWTRINNSTLYRRVLRRILPMGLRQRLFRLLLPKGPAALSAPRAETLDRLVAGLRGEAAEIGRWMGLEGPAWDLEATAQGLLQRNADDAH